MDYRYLRAFVLTAEHGNFTKAGEDLRIAQSAVSRQVKLLEESVNTQLLIRSPQKVTLTPAGESLFKQAKQFNSWVDDYFFETKETIRIGTLPGLLESWLTQKIFSFDSSELPNLRIDIGTVTSIIEDLETGKLDIGFLSQKIDTENLSSQRLFKEEFILISKNAVDLQKLHQHRWIYSDKAGYLRKTSKKISPNFIRVNSISTLLKMVEKGLGISIVPSHIIDRTFKFKKTPITNIKGSIYLCMPNYQILPGYLKEFINQINK